MRERLIYKTVESGEVEAIYHEKDGVVLIDKREHYQVGRAPMVMADIKPYQSVIDGSEISSRSRHREHLRQHNCVEVGNERMPDRPRPGVPGLKQDVIEAFHKARR